MKQVLSWFLVGLGLVGVAVGYWSIYILVAYFAAGIVWWASVLLFAGGPLALAGGVVSLRKPKQRVAAGLGFSGFALWVLLWFLCFAVVGFEFLPAGA